MKEIFFCFLLPLLSLATNSYVFVPESSWIARANAPVGYTWTGSLLMNNLQDLHVLPMMKRFAVLDVVDSLSGSVNRMNAGFSVCAYVVLIGK